MSPTSGFLIPLCVAASLVSVAAAQNPADAPEQLTARDMFYKPLKPSIAGSSSAPAKTGTAPKTAQVSSKSKATPAKSTAPPPVEVAAAQPKPSAAPAYGPVRDMFYSPAGGAAIIQAAARQTAPPPAEGPALGLRYTLVKPGGGGTEVATDTVFHNGDQIQLKIESNLAAYLYIITQGSSGTWKVQVPSSDVPGSNRLEALRPYYFPSQNQAFTFHDPTGTEKLFLIVSRQPLTDVQDQIYGLQGKPKPVSEPDVAPQRPMPLIQAKLEIPDDRIAQMRTMYSRDLIIEKVNPDTTGDKVEKKEFAMYVVNPSGSPSSRLVADVSLEHK